MKGTTDPPLPPLPARLESLQPNSKATIFLLGLALLIGMAGLIFGPAWAQTLFDAVDVTRPAGVMAAVAAVMAGILIHEAGHLLAALAVSFEILSVSLGPVRAGCGNGKWRFELHWKNSFSASVSAAPRQMEGWRRRLMAVVAGGPAATLLTGIGAVVLLGRQPGATWAHGFLGALAQFSIFVFVLGLIPNGRNVRRRNDAQLLYTLRKNTTEARQILLYYHVRQMEIAGVRPRNYPEGLIRELASSEGRVDSMLFYARTVARWASDRDDRTTAREWEKRCAQLSLVYKSTSHATQTSRSAVISSLSRSKTEPDAEVSRCDERSAPLLAQAARHS